MHARSLQRFVFKSTASLVKDFLKRYFARQKKILVRILVHAYLTPFTTASLSQRNRTGREGKSCLAYKCEQFMGVLQQFKTQVSAFFSDTEVYYKKGKKIETAKRYSVQVQRKYVLKKCMQGCSHAKHFFNSSLL